MWKLQRDWLVTFRDCQNFVRRSGSGCNKAPSPTAPDTQEPWKLRSDKFGSGGATRQRGRARSRNRVRSIPRRLAVAVAFSGFGGGGVDALWDVRVGQDVAVGEAADFGVEDGSEEDA